MDIKLNKSDEELKTAFSELQNRADVARLLEVSDKTLIFLLYRNKENNYEEFSIPKKSGGSRTIRAPVSTLKILQRKLSYILYLVHKPKSCAHGFSKEKSIRTNAEGHVKAGDVFNIDLENFFETITIQRVVGLFMKKPYSLPREAAVVLAQICCSPFGFLPQGAPTSPIISNMICSRMDGDLRRLAQERKCLYTRYADDISFSSRRVLSSAIVKLDYVDMELIAIPGDTLRQVIESNGFSINSKKVKYRNRVARQEITGLIVNERVNVKRKLMRQTRAMIHHYRTDQFVGDDGKKQKLAERIRGKLNFIRMIRGGKDRAYLVLANRYNVALGIRPYPIDDIEEIKFCTWFIEVEGRENGTAFMMDGNLITCNHVVGLSSHLLACRWDGDNKICYRVSVIKHSDFLDIAVLKFDDPLDEQYNYSLAQGDSDKVRERDTITVLGFPYYTDQKTLNYSDAKILGIKEAISPLFIVTHGTLVSGMSGGPAVNAKNEVIGVIAFGELTVGTNKQNICGVVPIKYASEIS